MRRPTKIAVVSIAICASVTAFSISSNAPAVSAQGPHHTTAARVNYGSSGDTAGNLKITLHEVTDRQRNGGIRKFDQISVESGKKNDKGALTSDVQITFPEPLTDAEANTLKQKLVKSSEAPHTSSDATLRALYPPTITSGIAQRGESVPEGAE